MLVYAFVLILGLNPEAMSSMGLHLVAPALFGPYFFFIYANYLCAVPNRAVKKRRRRKKRKDAGQMRNK